MLTVLLCPDSIPKDFYFFDFSIAPSLMLYSYVPAIIASFFIGLFVMVKSKFSLQGKLLFAISLSFAAWVLNYLIQWTIAYVTPDFLSWQLTPIFMLSMFFFSAYFVYVFLEKKDASLSLKLYFSLLFLPVILLLPSRYNINYFNLTACEGAAGNLWIYIYFVEILVILWVIFIGIKKYIKIKSDRSYRREVLLLTIGISLFLLISWLSDVLGEWTNQYQLNFIGPIGMTFFMGMLAFLIVRYKAFDIKLIGAQALIMAQFSLIGSMFFFAQNRTNQILLGVTFLGTIIMGWYLIRSMKKEIKRKEELQKISDALAMANERLKELDLQKSEFISIASHQLRTPLTAIKGYISLVLEGSYGKVPPTIQDVLDKVYTVNNRLTHLVEDLLNVSRIEAGRIQYSFAPTHLEPLVAELVDMFAMTAKSKNLSLKMQLPKVALPELLIDPNKIKEVVSNIIDNSLKYTKEGGTTVSVEGGDGVARVIISDTGIGILPENKGKLFEKFTRSKETTKMVASGAGLGLYVGKNFVEAHGGKIWAESDGADKGSRFIIELPFVNPKIHAGTSDQPSQKNEG